MFKMFLAPNTPPSPTGVATPNIFLPALVFTKSPKTICVSVNGILVAKPPTLVPPMIAPAVSANLSVPGIITFALPTPNRKPPRKPSASATSPRAAL